MSNSISDQTKPSKKSKEYNGKKSPEIESTDSSNVTFEEKIASIVKASFYNSLLESLRSGGKTWLKTWHVTDFASPCLRKVRYNKIMPVEMNAKGKRAVSVGDMVHRHSKLSDLNEITMCYDIEKDVSFTPAEVSAMTDEERANILTGTCDDVISVNGINVIVDKKTYNGRFKEKEEPQEDHIRQVNLYRPLLWESYGIDAPYGCNLYLNKAKDLEETVFVYPLDEISVTKKLMKDILHELQAKSIPKATINHLCDGTYGGNIFCPYLEQCKKDGREESKNRERND